MGFYHNFLQLSNGGIRVNVELSLADNSLKPAVISTFSLLVPLDEDIREFSRTVWGAFLLSKPEFFDLEDPVESLILEIAPGHALEAENKDLPKFPEKGWRAVAYTGSTALE